jgi:hypothetical protein
MKAPKIRHLNIKSKDLSYFPNPIGEYELATLKQAAACSNGLTVYYE